MNDHDDLSDNQARVLEFLRERIAQGETPTVREIMRHFGWGSPNAVMLKLRRLEQRGYITREPDKARSIRLADSLTVVLDGEVARILRKIAADARTSPSEYAASVLGRHLRRRKGL